MREGAQKGGRGALTKSGRLFLLGQNLISLFVSSLAELLE